MKKIIIELLMLCMLLSLAGCENNQADQDSAHDHDHNVVMNLRIGLSEHENEAHYKAAQQFASEVESKSEGAIKVTINGSNKMGNSEELLASLAENDNKVDIVIASVNEFLKYEPKMNISSMPFAIRDYNDVQSFMESDMQEEAQKSLLEHNMRVLAYYADGFHCLMMKNQNIMAPEDLREMTIAVSDNQLSAVAMKAMGARTAVVPSSEVRNGLLQGNFDGYEGSLKTIYEQQLYQGQKHLIVTNHCYSPSCFVISNRLWNDLESEYQDMIIKAARTSSYMDYEMVRQEELSMIKDLEKRGVRISYPDLKLFWAKAESAVKGYNSKYGVLTDMLISWKKVR